MKIIFTEKSWADYLWLQENDLKLLKRVNLLVKDVIRNPFDGIGKPEPHQHEAGRRQLRALREAARHHPREGPEQPDEKSVARHRLLRDVRGHRGHVEHE